jgi:leader peptidase (prepilin peptidase)/N-methyltransferase
VADVAARAVPVLVVLASLALIVVSTGGPWLVAVPLGTAALAALVDVRHRRLPNRLVAVTAVGSIVASLHVGIDSWVGAGAVVGLFAGPLLVARVVAPAAVGSGDVKLAAALAPLMIGGGAVAGVLAVWVASGSAGAVGVVRRRRSVAFGPALVVGTVVAGTVTAWGAP